MSRQERIHIVQIVRTSRTDPSDTFEGAPYQTLLSKIQADISKANKEDPSNIWTFRIKDVLPENCK